MIEEDLVFLEGLAGFGVVFTQVAPGTKRTTRTWDHFENLHERRGESRLDLVYEWLRKGFGVGYLLRNGLAAVDADDDVTKQRITDFEEREVYFQFPKVETPHDGVHALFQHPPSIDLNRLKNHVCHPFEDGARVAWDFKLGPRTMLMAPGTVMPDGAYRAGIWLPPPVLDIRYLAPELEIYKTSRPYLVDLRTEKDRIMAAMSYLRCKAPVSIEGKGQRKALRRVAEYLVGYLQFNPGFAFYLLTRWKTGKDKKGNPVTYVAWNDRCLDGCGSPAPWSDDKLWEALDDAVGDAPLHGVLKYKAVVEKEEARWHAADFIDMLTYLPQPKGDLTISKDALYRMFLEFTGVRPEVFRKCELGKETNRAIAIGKLPFVKDDRTAKARFYVGMDQTTVKVAMDTYTQLRKPILASA